MNIVQLGASKTSKIRALMFSILIISLSGFSQNLIKNGSFESGFTNWSRNTASVSTITLSNSIVEQGSSACGINITGKPANFWDISVGNGALTLKTGQNYILTFYAFSNTEGAIVDVVLQNSKYQAKQFILNKSWTKYTWIFSPLESSPNFTLQLGFSQNVGTTIYVDNIQLTAPTSSSSLPFSDSVSVNVSNKHQVIEGIGGALAYNDAAMFQNYNPNKPYTAALDSLFSGLRFSWVRFFNLWTDSTAYYKNYFVFDSAIVNQATKRLGHKPVIQITSWSAPPYLKQNNCVNGTNTTNPGIPTLKKNPNGTYKYDQFGQWWLRAIKQYQKFGINPDYISIQNELDYDVPYECTRFEPLETPTFAGYGPALNSVYNAIQLLAKKPKIIGPETYGIGGNQAQRYLNPLTNISQLAGYAHHLYSGVMDSPDDYLPDMSALSNYPVKKPIYQTEFYNYDSADPNAAMDLARLIHNTFVVEGASAYVHWNTIWGKVPSSLISNDGTFVTKYYFAFKQFSRFIHPGWTRVDGNSNSSYLRSSAYSNNAGDSLTVIVLNIGSQIGRVKINLGSFLANQGTIYQTNESTLKCVKTGVYLPGTVLSIPGGTISTLTFVKDIAPLVSITSPGNNLSFYAKGPISIGIKASDVDGKVKNVKIFDGKIQITTITSSSYNFIWSTSVLGIHTLTAVAMDNAGSSTTSAPVLVTIKPACLKPGSITGINGLVSVCGWITSKYSISTISGATSYFWKVPNGVSIVSGQNTPTVSLSLGSVGGQIFVSPVNACGTGTGASLSIKVNPLAFPNVSISNTSTSVCAGTNVTLTAVGINGGSAPTYSWFKNNVLVSSGISYNFTPQNGDAVYAKLTAGGTLPICLSPTTSLSNMVNIAVAPVPTVSATISSSSTSVCSGTEVTLHANGVNVGTNPIYSWYRNNSLVTIGGTYQFFPNNGDAIYATVIAGGTLPPCLIYSQNLVPNGNFSNGLSGWTNLAGSNGSSATFSVVSNQGISTYNAVINKLGINAWDIQTLGPQWSAIPGKTYTLNLKAKSSINGGDLRVVNQNVNYQAQDFILTPSLSSYSWTFVATESSPGIKFHLGLLGNAGNTINIEDVQISGPNENIALATATTNYIDLGVIPSIIPSISVSSSATLNLVCSNTGVSYSAVPTNLGSSPTYHWLVNGEIKSTGTTDFQYIPKASDQISVIATVGGNGIQCILKNVVSASGISIGIIGQCADLVPGIYQISPVNNLSFCLASGATSLIQTNCSGSNLAQQWEIFPSNLGGYYLKDLANNGYLTLPSDVVGSRLVTQSKPGNPFRLEYDGLTVGNSPTFRIAPSTELNNSIGNKTAQGINLFIQPRQTIDNQRFVFSLLSTTGVSAAREVNSQLNPNDQNSEEVSVACFPNPFTNNVNVYTNGNFEYSILNLEGFVQEQGKGNGSVTVGSSLPSGLYIIRVSVNNQIKNIKLAKD